MSIDIRLKHSSVQGKVPSPADLELGELALNVHENSPAAYIKDTAGNIVNIADQGGIEEAPNDGQQYARQNEAWSVVQGGGDGDVINYNGASAWARYQVGTGLVNSQNIAGIDESVAGVIAYTFATPMPNADYAVVATEQGTNGAESGVQTNNQTVNGFEVRTYSSSGNPQTRTHGVAVFATNAIAPPKGGTGC